MGASKYDGLKAKVKLATLLDAMTVPVTIPTKLANFAAFAPKNGWHDAAETLAKSATAMFTRTRRDGRSWLSAPALATFEAWQLSLWYQELALLRLLDHRGEYRNRLTAEWLGQVETVPWV
jgi:hypothetical protein